MDEYTIEMATNSIELERTHKKNQFKERLTFTRVTSNIFQLSQMYLHILLSKRMINYYEGMYFIQLLLMLLVHNFKIRLHIDLWKLRQKKWHNSIMFQTQSTEYLHFHPFHSSKNESINSHWFRADCGNIVKSNVIYKCRSKL